MLERTVLIHLQAETASSFVTLFPAQHPGQVSTLGSLGNVSIFLHSSELLVNSSVRFPS